MFRMMMKTMALVLAVGSSACLGQAPTGTGTINTGDNNVGTGPGGASDPTVGGNQGDTTGTQSNTTGGDTTSTFDHDNETDPFAVLQRIQQEGPPEVSTRMHSCAKMRYSTVGNLLTSLGVNLAKTSTPPSAGQLYKGGSAAMGSPNFGARIPEATQLTTAGAAKLFDVFTSAAPEIMAALNTKGTPIFDAQGRSTLDGLSILIGAPATQAQKDLFDSALTSASTPAIGQTIAIATLLSAVHTCE